MGSVFVDPVCPDTLAFRGSALAAWDDLAKSKSNTELLKKAHEMWCGDKCPEDVSCGFLHYNRETPVPGKPQAPMPRFNQRTASVFRATGGTHYAPNVIKHNQINLWPVLYEVLRRVDATTRVGGLIHCDYTNWSGLNDSTMDSQVARAFRDTIQYMAIYNGKIHSIHDVAVQYVAMGTCVDELCIPPLDLINERYRQYGLSGRDIIDQMVKEGWKQDATHALLTEVRQFIYQYVEKVDYHFGNTIHETLNTTAPVWDGALWHTNSGNIYGMNLVIQHAVDVGPCTYGWIYDSAICDTIAMSLGKSATTIFQLDLFPPVKAEDQSARARKQAEYYSLLIDLSSDLVTSGAPEPLIHFGLCATLFVLLVDRYHERAKQGRIPLEPRVAEEIGLMAGPCPMDAALEGIYRLHFLAQYGAEGRAPPEGPQGQLAKELLLACHKRAELRKLAYKAVSQAEAFSLPDGDQGECGTCACANHWVSKVHAAAQSATNPAEMRRLLVSGEVLGDDMALSDTQLGLVGHLDNIWALCVACRFGCGVGCEWKAFASYTWQRFFAASHQCGHA
ncbi:hypothetical protein BP00DRAFT_412310 [Aspergillus indologenus CBS 114.80]|uniref:Uncharacterized protein n=1 Tax=Aspergillus indologenus CBS 114.80 TaxID=1450541 RepID=A0A2V5JGA9_9EURO|nr:hypothetical protein BP00DRAFT_412310 [Aspergillus indologenus CBS 114.80]